jgi:hypothetical protein
VWAVATEPSQEVKPRTVTLQRDRVPLSEALKELTRQSGVAVADLTGKGNVALSLTFKDQPFWQALDRIAAAAGARVSLYSPKGVALVEAVGGKQTATPALSYHGSFRTSIRHLRVDRDLESGAHTCVAQLDLAWEPHFTAFLVETGPATVTFARDAQGKVLRAQLPALGREQITPPACAHEITLRMPAPARSSPWIETLKGTFVVGGAGKMLDFTFARLREIGSGGKAEEQTREGVKVRLTEASHETDPDRFIVEVAIDNPPGGPRFESYQSWIGANAIRLEKAAGGRQRLVPSPRDTEVVKLTAGQAVVRYHFTQKANPGVRFGKLSDWALHYRTPGRMVEVSVPYEFKHVPLP